MTDKCTPPAPPASRPGPRAVIPHIDDLGATLGANLAFRELADAGRVTCGSVMVPAPWFRHTVDTCGDLDIGVHFTLTSEWQTYRWAPISTISRASGLIDNDGYFWPNLDQLRRHVVPEAAEAELRAQVERAVAAGLAPTHCDAHMAAAMLPALLDIHIRLAREYGLFPVLPRSITWAPDPETYRQALEALTAKGAPIVDHCRGTLPVAPARLRAEWRRLLAALPPGLTHLALHATTPGDFASIAPDHAVWRFAEYRLLRTGAFAKLLEEADIETTGLRPLHQRWLTIAPKGRSLTTAETAKPQ